MAHYALLDENNVVVQVITGRNEDEVVGDVTDWEAHYSEVTGLVAKRTSYNTYRHYELDENRNIVSMEIRHSNGGIPFRGQYARIGDVYDVSKNEFVTPKETDETV